LLAACSVVLPAPDAGIPIEDVDTEPRQVEVDAHVASATGPTVEVLRGRVQGSAFALSVHATAEGFCSLLSRDSGTSGSCGPLPGEGMPEFGPFGSFGHGGGDADGAVAVSGVVSKDAAAVWVELDGGERARMLLIDLAPAEIDAQAFVGFLDAGAALHAIVALDGLGNEIGRVPLIGGPAGPGDGGAMPTPVAP
jgi:hypothetical protein